MYVTRSYYVGFTVVVHLDSNQNEWKGENTIMATPKTPIARLFDKVLELTDGDVITLTFTSEKDMNSKRVMLFREKRKYEMATGSLGTTIFIRQDTAGRADGIFKLHMSVSGSDLDWITNATVTSRTGIERPLGLEVTEEEAARIAMLEK